jgi:hypothetical protein
VKMSLLPFLLLCVPGLLVACGGAQETSPAVDAGARPSSCEAVEGAGCPCPGFVGTWRCVAATPVCVCASDASMPSVDVRLIDVPGDASVGLDATADVSGRDSGVDAAQADVGQDVTASIDVALRDVASDAVPTADRGAPSGDVLTPADACGPCETGPNVASAACRDGRCVLTCQDGFADCDGQQGNGCEADLRSNGTCGRCDNSCRAPVNGRSVCEAGRCGVECDLTFHLCGGQCVSNDSPSTCGMRCTPCPIPSFSASVFCEAGSCGFRCAAGYHACLDRCVEDSSVIQCGPRCERCTAPEHATAVCRAGACAWSCNFGYVELEGRCVIAPPRPVRPLSAGRVNSNRPTMTWRLSPGTTGTRVEIARDRLFTDPVSTFDASGEQGRPDVALAPGVYFWRLRNREGTVLGAAMSPVWEFVVARGTSTVDTTWGTMPDVNGDGLADVVLPTSSGTAPPAAYVYLGVRGRLPTMPSQTLRLPGQTSGLFGRSIAIVPDLNGDGFADLVVAGRHPVVMVLNGAANGIQEVPSRTLPAPELGRNFGISVAGLGDVNGDGYGDLLVGATAGSEGGRVYLYSGGPGGVGETPSVTLLPPVRAGTDYVFGERVAPGGDLNGDGYADLLVSAVSSLGSGVCEYRGGASGVGMTRCVLEGTSSSRRADSVILAEDFDGDGLADYAQAGRGHVSLTLGARDGEFRRAHAIFPPSVDDYIWGAALGAVWDVDGDGRDELAVGRPRTSQPGNVYVYRGNTASTTTTSAWTLTTRDDVSGGFGQGAIAARDMDGDGRPELLAGSSQGEGPGIGRVYFYVGSQTGFPEYPTSVLLAPGGQGLGLLIARRTTVRAPVIAYRQCSAARWFL